MAKTYGPLFSETAHGTIGGVLTYSTKDVVKQVRYQKKQQKVETEERLVHWKIFKAIIGEWHDLTDSEKADWDKLAVKLHMTGYNLYVKSFFESILGG